MPNGEIATGEMEGETGKLTISSDYTDEGKTFKFNYNPTNGQFRLQRVFECPEDEKEKRRKDQNHLKEVNLLKIWNPKLENMGPNYTKLTDCQF